MTRTSNVRASYRMKRTRNGGFVMTKKSNIVQNLKKLIAPARVTRKSAVEEKPNPSVVTSTSLTDVAIAKICSAEFSAWTLYESPDLEDDCFVGECMELFRRWTFSAEFGPFFCHTPAQEETRTEPDSLLAALLSVADVSLSPAAVAPRTTSCPDLLMDTPAIALFTLPAPPQWMAALEDAERDPPNSLVSTVSLPSNWDASSDCLSSSSIFSIDPTGISTVSTSGSFWDTVPCQLSMTAPVVHWPVEQQHLSDASSCRTTSSTSTESVVSLVGALEVSNKYALLASSPSHSAHRLLSSSSSCSSSDSCSTTSSDVTSSSSYCCEGCNGADGVPMRIDFSKIDWSSTSSIVTTRSSASTSLRSTDDDCTSSSSTCSSIRPPHCSECGFDHWEPQPPARTTTSDCSLVASSSSNYVSNESFDECITVYPANSEHEDAGFESDVDSETSSIESLDQDTSSVSLPSDWDSRIFSPSMASDPYPSGLCAHIRAALNACPRSSWEEFCCEECGKHVYFTPFLPSSTSSSSNSCTNLRDDVEWFASDSDYDSEDEDSDVDNEHPTASDYRARGPCFPAPPRANLGIPLSDGEESTVSEESEVDIEPVSQSSTARLLAECDTLLEKIKELRKQMEEEME